MVEGMNSASLARAWRACPSQTVTEVRRTAANAHTVRIVRIVLAWLPAVAIATVIFALSSLRDLHATTGTLEFVLRKGAHTTVYALLALTIVRGLHAHGLSGRAALSTAFLLAVAYAVSDELHQTTVPTRHGAATDVAIDAIGSTAGLVLATRPAVLRRLTAWT